MEPGTDPALPVESGKLQEGRKGKWREGARFVWLFCLSVFQLSLSLSLSHEVMGRRNMNAAG